MTSTSEDKSCGLSSAGRTGPTKVVKAPANRNLYWLDNLYNVIYKYIPLNITLPKYTERP